MRQVEEPLGDRLGRDHLAAGRDDQPFDLPEQTAGIAVCGDEHRARVDGRQRFDAAVLVNFDAGLGGADGEPPHPAGRLEGGVGRV